jgi:hypothetical protein
VKRSSLRTLIVGGSALALVTSISPLASADTATASPNSASTATPMDNPQIGTYPKDNDVFNARMRSIQGVGDAIANQARELMKRLGKNGANNPTIAAAFTAFQTSRTNAITLYNQQAAAAKANYSSAIAPALIALGVARAKAKGDAIALKAANDAFRISTKAAVSAYRVATLPAQTAFRTTMAAANTTLMNMIKSFRGASLKPAPIKTN